MKTTAFAYETARQNFRELVAFGGFTEAYFNAFARKYAADIIGFCCDAAPALRVIRVKASELRVGDKFTSGATITAADAYTLPGYEVDYVRTMDTGMKTCLGAHFPVSAMVSIQARAA